MSLPHSFDSAVLFRGTASYYARFRPGYPEAFLQLIVERYAGDGAGRLLDLGCGTGQLAIALAPHFREVLGVDVDPEMLAEAVLAARRAGVDGIRWLQATAEALPPDLQPVRLVTLGRSFHWMDRDIVLERLWDLVEPGGGVVITGDGCLWENPVEPFQQVAKDVIRRWLGERRRAGGAFYPAELERHEAPLSRSRFVQEERYMLPVVRTWTIDQVVGYCYSLSFCSPALLGERKAAFEADLRQSLDQLQPGEPFQEPVELEAFFLRRP